MRLIDADALVKELSGKYIVPVDEATRGVAAFMGIQMRQAINNAPTIETVPLEDYRSMEQTVYKLTQALAEAEPRWIPCSERLPERDKAVLITWVNHKPMSYYADTKDVPFTAVAVWHGIWYWWSVVCEDFLVEYGRNEADEIDKDVEVIAWMPLPKPYETDEVKNERT